MEKNYYINQVILILGLQERHGCTLNEAISDYIQNHAKKFHDVWEEHPEERDNMAGYYWVHYIKRTR